MPMTITGEDGKDILVLTREEVEAQRAELEAKHKAELEAKDAHVKEKLDQFQQAKGGAEKANEAALALAEEAKKIAQEASQKVEEANRSALETKKAVWIKSVTGGDAELTKKVEDAYAIINLPEATDAEIMDRVRNAVAMARITSVNMPNMSFGGAQAPNFQKSVDQAAKDASYNNFVDELGLKDLVPKPKQ